jgi:hypothetical protein
VGSNPTASSIKRTQYFAGSFFIGNLFAAGRIICFVKNNTLAMLATISLAVSVAILISYIDPTVCAGSGIQSLEACTQLANEHIWGFVGFFSFGAITLFSGAVRNVIRRGLARKKTSVR